ncbi:hypothetical protein GCM10010172_44490 [Paractinoplanes ferrugineus]|uniref:Uncharacterized protein n=1 Tax=Paractinoplanes ferrugineus TaxID=113564 RepID=A0A919MMU1_9ACTN|nr:hypothetical protein [Actinoplanes ferrugineus]GIE13607.1 hypothetical protein Afe05nite_54470 [Actinoplanes ferrugineus]
MSTQRSDSGEFEDRAVTGAGSETDQHITGSKETGDFLTDQPPGYTPANGSSNVGINERRANREQPDENAG